MTGSASVLSTAAASSATSLPGWHQTTASLPAWGGPARSGYEGNYVGVACDSALVCTAVLTANPANSTADPGQYTAGTVYTSDGGASWTGSFDNSQNQLANLDAIPNSIQCSGRGSTDCTALETTDTGSYGSFLRSSTDSGKTWGLASEVNLPPVNGNLEQTTLRGLDCTSGTYCLAVGLSGSGTSLFQGMVFGPSTGGEWLGNGPSDADAFLSVSCLSTQCWMAGQQAPATVFAARIYETGNGGLGWVARRLPNQPSSYSVFPGASPGKPFVSASEVTCKHGAGSTLQSKSDCYAVQWDGGNGAGSGSGYPPELLYSHNGGSTWSVGIAGNLEGSLVDGISCPSSLVCYAYGLYGGSGAVWATTDGGITWTLQLVSGSIQITSVSCPTTSTCFAGGTTTGTSEIFQTTDGGYTTAPPPTPPTAVSATAAIRSAKVKWKAPAFDGGAPIEHYFVKPFDHTLNKTGHVIEVAGSSLSVTMTGLTAAHHYTFTVKAKTVDGTSHASTASRSVVPTA